MVPQLTRSLSTGEHRFKRLPRRSTVRSPGAAADLIDRLGEFAWVRVYVCVCVLKEHCFDLVNLDVHREKARVDKR